MYLSIYINTWPDARLGITPAMPEILVYLTSGT